MSTVIGCGCAWCFHVVIGEGRALKEILNPLLGPKSKFAVCGYCVVLGLLLYLYICMFHDLIVNF